MISFRFYVVSMTAMFLALALGVVIGSALDESIVEGLENRITTVDERAKLVASENDDLRDAAERDEELIAAAAPHMVDGAMEAAPVLLVAERGLDVDVVSHLQDMINASGAVTPGVLWLEKGWILENEEAREDLAAGLDVTVAEPSVLRARAWRLLSEQLVALEPTPPTTTPPVAPSTTAGGPGTTAAGGPATTAAPVTAAPTTTVLAPIDALTALEEAGLVTLEPVAEDGPVLQDLLGEGVTVIVITGPGGDLEGTGFIASLVATQAEVGVPTVLAAVAEGEEPGEALRAVRADEALRERVSTVDDAHLAVGRAAAVLAAADLERAVVGHYGELDGTDRGLPVWTERPSE